MTFCRSGLAWTFRHPGISSNLGKDPFPIARAAGLHDESLARSSSSAPSTSSGSASWANTWPRSSRRSSSGLISSAGVRSAMARCVLRSRIVECLGDKRTMADVLPRRRNQLDRRPKAGGHPCSSRSRHASIVASPRPGASWTCRQVRSGTTSACFCPRAAASILDVGCGAQPYRSLVNPEATYRGSITPMPSGTSATRCPIRPTTKGIAGRSRMRRWMWS